MLGLQRAGPIHAFRGARAHGSFEQARLDEDLFGRQIEFADQLIDFRLFPFCGQDHELAGADISHDFAALIDQRGLHAGDHIGRIRISELENLGLQRIGSRGIFDGHAIDFGLGVLDQLQAVVVQQRIEGLFGGHILPADRNRRLRRGHAVRAGLAESDFRIEHIIKTGLASQVLDRVRQRDIIHDDQRNDRASIGGSSFWSIGLDGLVRRDQRGRSRSGSFGERGRHRSGIVAGRCGIRFGGGAVRGWRSSRLHGLIARGIVIARRGGFIVLGEACPTAGHQPQDCEQAKF